MNELEWLAERRPETGEPSAAATARARDALLDHAETPPRQDTRIPFADEDQRRPQSACGAPQEGTSSAHP